MVVSAFSECFLLFLFVFFLFVCLFFCFFCFFFWSGKFLPLSFKPDVKMFAASVEMASRDPVKGLVLESMSRPFYEELLQYDLQSFYLPVQLRALRVRPHHTKNNRYCIVVSN